MDWIHCNTCFVLPSSSNQFHLTSCGHLFCNACLHKNGDKKCRTCDQTYAGAIALTNKMKPDVQMYFMDTKDLCKNILKQVQQVQLVSEFQKGHSQRLTTFHKQKLNKFNEMIGHARELERHHREVLSENEKLKNFITSMGHQVTDVLGRPSVATYPMTPKTPVTPGVKRSYSNQSLMGHSQRSSPMGMPNRGVTPGGRPMNHPSSSPMQQSPHMNRSIPKPSPAGSAQRGLSKTPNSHPSSISPRNTPKSLIAAGRISMRTPPINGKLGPIAKSPYISNSQICPSSQPPNRTPISRMSTPNAKQIPSSSKIAQNLQGKASPRQNYLQTPGDERKPIQLDSSRSFSFSKR